MSDKKRILLVEDEPQMAELIKMRLESQPYEVYVIHDGKEGYEMAKMRNPDLIILDLMLPSMDGYKICGLLKRDGRYAKIPVLIFTAKAQEEDRQLAQEAGADAYMTKPFEAKALLAKIEELLNG